MLQEGLEGSFSCTDARWQVPTGFQKPPLLYPPLGFYPPHLSTKHQLRRNKCWGLTTGPIKLGVLETKTWDLHTMMENTNPQLHLELHHQTCLKMPPKQSSLFVLCSLFPYLFSWSPLRLLQRLFHPLDLLTPPYVYLPISAFNWSLFTET